MLWLTALLVAGGCAPAEEPEGSFQFEQVQQYQACFETASPIEPEFFTAVDNLDSYTLFFQTRTWTKSLTDMVTFDVFRPGAIRDRLGERIPLRPEPGADTLVRGEVAFAQSCPDRNAAFRLEGFVVFDRFETEDGGIIEGRWVDGRVIDARTGEVVVEQASGDWRFPFRKAPPYQNYPTFEREYPRHRP